MNTLEITFKPMADGLDWEMPDTSCLRTRCGLGQAALRPKLRPGARSLAVMEIRFEPPHSGLMFFEQPRNQATKPDNLVPSLLCCPIISRLANAAHSE
jgi:hypothetical protein